MPRILTGDFVGGNGVDDPSIHGQAQLNGPASLHGRGKPTYGG